MSDDDNVSTQPDIKISILQKLEIFVIIPVVIVSIGVFIYHKQLLSTSTFIAAGIIIFIIFIVSAYILIRRLVKRKYDEFRKLQLLSITDELTQLYTKDHFISLFDNEFARAIRYERVFCCAVIEIDNLDLIAEEHGQQFCNDILQEAADSLRDDLRVIDVLARDGDRFLCLLPETDIEPALFVSKRLRSMIQGDTFQNQQTKETINITISIGITSCKPCLDKEATTTEILDLAYVALNTAIGNGGNKVEYLPSKTSKPVQVEE